MAQNMSSEYPFILIEEECERKNVDELCFCLNLSQGYVSRGCEYCERCFVEHPYEKAYEKTYDLEHEIVIKDHMIFPSRSLEGFLVNKGVKIKYLILEGLGIDVIITEGSFVKKQDKIAYIYTGKREIRTIRSLLEGFVLYITELYGEFPYKTLIIFLEDINSLRKIMIK